jgi:hypothetical protein
MHPLLLHQMADDRVLERRRTEMARHRYSRRPVRTHRVARLRVALGGILIAVGTRLAGRHTGAVGLQSRPSA